MRKLVLLLFFNVFILIFSLSWALAPKQFIKELSKGMSDWDQLSNDLKLYKILSFQGETKDILNFVLINDKIFYEFFEKSKLAKAFKVIKRIKENVKIKKENIKTLGNVIDSFPSIINICYDYDFLLFNMLYNEKLLYKFLKEKKISDKNLRKIFKSQNKNSNEFNIKKGSLTHCDLRNNISSTKLYNENEKAFLIMKFLQAEVDFDIKDIEKYIKILEKYMNKQKEYGQIHEQFKKCLKKLKNTQRFFKEKINNKDEDWEKEKEKAEEYLRNTMEHDIVEAVIFDNESQAVIFDNVSQIAEDDELKKYYKEKFDGNTGRIIWDKDTFNLIKKKDIYFNVIDNNKSFIEILNDKKMYFEVNYKYDEWSQQSVKKGKYKIFKLLLENNKFIQKNDIEYLLEAIFGKDKFDEYDLKIVIMLYNIDYNSVLNYFDKYDKLFLDILKEAYVLDSIKKGTYALKIKKAFLRKLLKSGNNKDIVDELKSDTNEKLSFLSCYSNSNNSKEEKYTLSAFYEFNDA